MKRITMIACISKDNGLGNNGDLLWHIPADMKFFRETTTGGMVIMGRNTFEGIGQALPKRVNVVLSRSEVNADGVKWAKNLEELQRIIADTKKNVYIIGGAMLYQTFIEQADKLLLTEVDSTKPADVFFPEFNRMQYDQKVLQTGEFEGIKYQVAEYIKKEDYGD